jgi:dihydroorotate dehydrogenase
VPIVGAGGIFTAEDAWAKLTAGASLVQIYTGFIYEGPAIARRINRGLVRLMEQHGLHSLSEVTGSGAGGR